MTQDQPRSVFGAMLFDAMIPRAGDTIQDTIARLEAVPEAYETATKGGKNER